jgi:hypothetical protein
MLNSSGLPRSTGPLRLFSVYHMTVVRLPDLTYAAKAESRPTSYIAPGLRGTYAQRVGRRTLSTPAQPLCSPP